MAVVNVGQIDQAFEDGEEVTLRALAAKNLARGRFDVLKVLGDGELSKKVKVNAHRFSKSAAEKIEKSRRRDDRHRGQDARSREAEGSQTKDGIKIALHSTPNG